MKKEKLLETLKNCIPAHAPRATKKAMENMVEKIADSLRNYYEMPCQLGDTATDISEYFDDTENPQKYSYIVESIAIEQDGDEVIYIVNNNWWYKEEDINKIVFFGQDGYKRAEKAVKEKEEPTFKYLSNAIVAARGSGKFTFPKLPKLKIEYDIDGSMKYIFEDEDFEARW